VKENYSLEMRLDKAVSTVFHPIMVLPVSAFLVLNFSGLNLWDSFYWFSIWMVMSLVPTVAVVWRIGEPGLEVPERQQRLKPFTAALLSLLASILFFTWISAPETVLKLAVTGVVTVALFGAANFIDKVSIHTGSMTAVAVLFSTFSVSAGLLVSLFSLFVGWSRIRLGRHSPVQVLQGGFLGALCGLIFLLL
jgi:membrane-associated phospholipid phosphatase